MQIIRTAVLSLFSLMQRSCDILHITKEPWDILEFNICVYISSPVTIFPTIWRARISTKGVGAWTRATIFPTRAHASCTTIVDKWITHIKSSTSPGQTPASITTWILLFVPSERYEGAQQASIKTLSFEWIRGARARSVNLIG